MSQPRLTHRSTRRSPAAGVLLCLALALVGCGGGGGGDHDAATDAANPGANSGEDGTPMPAQAMASAEAFTRFVMSLLAQSEDGVPMRMSTQDLPPVQDTADPLALP